MLFYDSCVVVLCTEYYGLIVYSARVECCIDESKIKCAEQEGYQENSSLASEGSAAQLPLPGGRSQAYEGNV